MKNSAVNVFWFRRDLRVEDNAALYHALKEGPPVLPVFIFDRNILDDLESPSDQRVNFIHGAIRELQEKLKEWGSGIDVLYGFPEEVFETLTKNYQIIKVFTNHDYEPYAIQRDTAVDKLLRRKGIAFQTYKDHVIFEKDEILKNDGTPYTVFTPYSRKWLSSLTSDRLRPYPVKNYAGCFVQKDQSPVPTLEEMGFRNTSAIFPGREVNHEVLVNYAEQRNFPAQQGTSRLGVHLRFGTVSIREVATIALQKSKVFMNELIWRDFYQMILWKFPAVGEGRAFKPEYDRIPWRNDEEEFSTWKEGRTGYPLVDAGMRELNETGFMHNRVRMVTASFLTKHLLIDWRWGEAYFAEKLLDFDFASNNGGWQWASGSGCDASPYFRIFNPYIQTKKFDPKLQYVSKWVPEFQEFSYPSPVVDHEFARKRCIEVYSKALAKP